MLRQQQQRIIRSNKQSNNTNINNNISYVLRYMSNISFNKLLQYNIYNHNINHILNRDQQLQQCKRLLHNSTINTQQLSTANRQRPYKTSHYSSNIITDNHINRNNYNSIDYLHHNNNNHIIDDNNDFSDNIKLRAAIYSELADEYSNKTGRNYINDFIDIEQTIRDRNMPLAKAKLMPIMNIADISLWHKYLTGLAKNTIYINELMYTWKLFVQYQQPTTISYNILARGLKLYYDQVMTQNIYDISNGNTIQQRQKLPLYIHDLIEQMYKTDIQVNTYLYNLLVQEYYDNEMYDSVLATYERMKSSNSVYCEPDVFTYNTLFKTLNAKRKKQGKSSHITTNNDQQHSNDQLTTSEYVKYWNELKSYNILPSAVLYRTLLEQLQSTSTYTLFFELFYDIIYRNVIPDNQLMRVILVVCCQLDRCDDALLAYKYMKRHNLVPTVSIITSIMTIFARKADINAVNMLWSEMIHYNLQPSNATINALMQTFIKMNDNQRAIDVFDNISSFNIEPTEYLYTTLLSACKDNISLTIKYFNQAKQSNITISDVMYTQIIDCCKANDDIDNILIYITEMYDNNYKLRFNDIVWCYQAIVNQLKQCIQHNENQDKNTTDIILDNNDIDLDLFNERINIINELFNSIKTYKINYDMSSLRIEYYSLTKQYNELSECIRQHYRKDYYFQPLEKNYIILLLNDMITDNQQYSNIISIYHALANSCYRLTYDCYEIYYIMIQCYIAKYQYNSLINLLYNMQKRSFYMTYTTYRLLTNIYKNNIRIYEQLHNNKTQNDNYRIIYFIINLLNKNKAALQYNYSIYNLDYKDYDEIQALYKRNPQIFKFKYRYHTYRKLLPIKGTASLQRYSGKLLFNIKLEQRRRQQCIDNQLDNHISNNRTKVEDKKYVDLKRYYRSIGRNNKKDNDSSSNSNKRGQRSHSRSVQKLINQIEAEQLNKVLPQQYVTELSEITELNNNNNSIDDRSNTQSDNTTTASDNLFDSLLTNANKKNQNIKAGHNDARWIDIEEYNKSINNHNDDTNTTKSLNKTDNNSNTNTTTTMTKQSDIMTGFNRGGLRYELSINDTPCIHFWSVSGCAEPKKCRFNHQNDIRKLSDRQIQFLISKNKNKYLTSKLTQTLKDRQQKQHEKVVIAV